MRLACWIAVLSFLGTFAAAQSADHVEIFGGYSYINSDYSLTTRTGVSGWNAAVNLKFAPHVGLVADFSGYYPSHNFGCSGCGQHGTVHNFLFGPQVSFAFGRVTPFARFLIGASHTSFTVDSLPGAQILSSSNAVLYGAGGGVDFGLTRRFALRGQVDWLHNGFSTADNQLHSAEVHNVARLSTGIVFRF